LVGVVGACGEEAEGGGGRLALVVPSIALEQWNTTGRAALDEIGRSIAMQLLAKSLLRN
jgi:hypothetical protein